MKIYFLLFFFFPCLFLFTQQYCPDLYDIENNLLRREYKKKIIQSTADVLMLHSGYLTSGSGRRVHFDIQRKKDFYFILFTNELNNSFPVFSAGSVIIKRSIKDGSFLQIKMFIRNDPGCFIRIFPLYKDLIVGNGSNNSISELQRSSMDVYLYGKLLYENIILPCSFDTALTISFSKIVEMTGDSVEWELLLPEKKKNSENLLTKKIAQKIRAEIPGLREAEDGAIDEDGEYVYIETLEKQFRDDCGLNCSGFAKWVVDGLFYPIHGKYIEISRLKEKHPDLRGSDWSERYEDQRDPYFGLDWIRNLGFVMKNTDARSYLQDRDKIDVSGVPFFKYTTNVGYPVRDLKLLFYFLARIEPGYIYIGSVNREVGKKPMLRQYVHVVVFCPYIDENDEIVVDVFERYTGVLETNLESLEKRFRNDYIHLVRIRAEGDFYHKNDF